MRIVTRNEIGEMVEHVIVNPGILGAGAGFKPPEQRIQIRFAHLWLRWAATAFGEFHRDENVRRNPNVPVVAVDVVLPRLQITV